MSDSNDDLKKSIQDHLEIQEKLLNRRLRPVKTTTEEDLEKQMEMAKYVRQKFTRLFNVREDADLTSKREEEDTPHADSND